ncbi:MAG: pentapeptide repeat-containing protein [Coleofasciculus sp.]
MSEAVLKRTNLSRANLEGADLSQAALDEAVTLTDAIMPDGSKHSA